MIKSIFIRTGAAAALALAASSFVPVASSAQSFGEAPPPWCFSIKNLSEHLANGGECRSGYPHYSGSPTEILKCGGTEDLGSTDLFGEFDILSVTCCGGSAVWDEFDSLEGLVIPVAKIETVC